METDTEKNFLAVKKIAYIEIDTHAEIVGDFKDLVSSSDKFRVDYYLSDRILKILQLEENNYIFRANESNLLSLLKNKTYDLVIIGTAHRYFNVFENVTDIFKTAIICHNFNFIKTSNTQLFLNIFRKETKFRLKLWLKEGLLKKNKVYKKADIHWVLDKNLVSEGFTYLPLFFHQEIFGINNEIFTIVIPGSVSQKRRNYREIIDEVRDIKNTQFRLVFLGKAIGEELRWIKDLEREKREIEVIYFTEKVPNNIFDEWLKKADILWCPIQYETEFFSVKEIYGKTKMSGNIGDAIKYGKMAVFPEIYQDKYPFLISKNKMWKKIFLSNTEGIFNSYGKELIIDQLEKILLNSAN